MHQHFQNSEIRSALTRRSARDGLEKCLSQWREIWKHWLEHEQLAVIQLLQPGPTLSTDQISLDRPEFQRILRREDAIEALERELSGRFRWLRELIPDSFDVTLKKSILENLPEPLALTLDDLKDVVWDALRRVTPSDATDFAPDAADRFVVEAQRELSALCSETRSTSPFLVAQVNGGATIDELPEVGWSGKHGRIIFTELRATEVYRRGRDFNFRSPNSLYAELEGLFSPRAAVQEKRRCKRLLRACLTLAGDVVEEVRARCIGNVAASVDETTVIDGMPLINYWLCCTFAARSGDDLRSRISTAILLYEQAHHQSHDAVAVALTFAAIESIVGDRTTSVRKIMETRIPALLQPDRQKREELGKLVGKLYGLRCNLIHGSELGSPKIARVLVRVVLAKLLHVSKLWDDGGRSMRSTPLPAFLAQVVSAAEKEHPFGISTTFNQEDFHREFSKMSAE